LIVVTAAYSIVKAYPDFCQSESAHHHAEQSRERVLPGGEQYAALMELFLRKRQKYFLEKPRWRGLPIMSKLLD